ncbi:MAG TPA: HXXEE domain-containing protein, partial [Anaerolineales bacterium]
AAVALHEAEEWNILEWEQRNFVNVPPKTRASTRTFLVFFSLLGFLLTGMAVLLGSPKLAAWIVLAFAAGASLNALQHVYYAVLFRQYAPGVITAILLCVPTCSYLVLRALQEHLVPPGYVAALLAVVVLGLIQTMKEGNTFGPFFRAVSQSGMILAKWLHISRE